MKKQASPKKNKPEAIHIEACAALHEWANEQLTSIEKDKQPFTICGQPSDANYRAYYLLSQWSRNPQWFSELLHKISWERDACIAEQMNFVATITDLKLREFLFRWQGTYVRAYNNALKWAKRKYPKICGYTNIREADTSFATIPTIKISVPTEAA